MSIDSKHVVVSSAVPVKPDVKKASRPSQSKDGKDGKEGKDVVGPRKDGGKVRMGSSQVHSLLAGLALTPSAAETVLRQELLNARFRASTASVDDIKHVYYSGTFTLADTEGTLPFCRVIGGSAFNQRLTNAVTLKSLKFRFIVDRQPTATGTVAARSPVLSIVIWRDKIPSTPGTAPTIYGTDTSPPASGTLMFSRLGQSNTSWNSIAVLNPITVPSYHIYHVHHMDLNDSSTYDYVTPATAYGLPGPKKWRDEIHVDLNDVQQDYAIPTSTAPDVNDVYITVITDMSYTNQGYQDVMWFTTDTEFRDKQL